MALLDTAFPWIGLVAAIPLLALLAGNALRMDRSVARWRDWGWLSWAGVAAYLVHNVEEYGLDLHGEAYAFPKAFCAMFGFPDLYPACPVPGDVFTAVNVLLFWIAAPWGAWLAKRHPWAGLGLYGVIAVNMLAHIGRALADDCVYNPGLLTAVVVFLPMAFWVLVGARLWPKAVVVAVVALGFALHGILIAGMLLLIKGVVQDAGIVTLIQVCNAGLMIALPLLAERVVRYLNRSPSA